MWPRLFGKRRQVRAFPPVAPDRPVEIVGDIHGRFDLLCGLPPRGPDAVRVYVGDYVDRGPASRQVLEQMYRESLRDDTVCLIGNHEAMLLGFLEDPGRAQRWLRFGGLQTLASFGVQGVSETAKESALRDAAAAVLEGLSFDIVAWLEARPAIWSSGTLSVAHAGLDPVLPVNAQAREVVVWGHPDFGVTARSDARWVAHGHTIVDTPVARNGVISIDTGAYATGRLTLARVTPDGQISFSEASDELS